jgi:hypothetical protein
MSQPMPPPPQPPAGVPPSQQVQGPAIGLMVAGGLGVLISLLSLLANLVGFGTAGMPGMGDGPSERWVQMMGGGLGAALALIGLVIWGFVLWSALQMRTLRGWGMAVAASILAMIPCGCACVIGLPLGIWSLIVLLRPEVRAAFTP